ncbi:MAG: 2-oxoacid:ferredoxin oxidoreductase subunit beta [Phycisphaerae bacterium]|nr:2-oxoacid:ferredoxin oxidoreductase subunit beta [Phycisphaerae bacterium]
MATLPTLDWKELKSESEVRWCPGCGDYSILMQVQKVLAQLGVDRDRTVFVSGIGCSSRFPYYMNTYGFHTIHGRAPAVATGIKCANPELDVWVITGDGDGFSIGGNHILHLLRRNVNLKVILFNNRIYGLTKGQYSPTSEVGKVTKSTPFGSIDGPLNPLGVAIAAGATFIARTVDVDVQHQQQVLKRAAAHVGTAFVEVYQDCNVYNHKAWDYATDRETKPETVLYLEHGKPMMFGKQRDRGIRLNGLTPEVVTVGAGIAADDLLHHDESAPTPTLAYLLAQMRRPEFPEPMGVLRAVNAPTYESLLMSQVAAAQKKLGPGDLDALFNDADTWTVQD